MPDNSSRVRVFRNHKLGGYTILNGTRVIASAHQVRLADVEFLVRESGRLRMIARGRRNIHAYAIGHLVDFVRAGDVVDLAPIAGRRATYNPLSSPNFCDDETHVPLAGAALVQLDQGGIVYSGGEIINPAKAA